MILLCRITLLTGGGGCSIPLTGTLLRVLITILRQWLLLLIGGCLTVFDTSRFLLRFIYSFGGFFAIDCPPEIIYFVDISSLRKTVSVWEGAAHWRPWTTSSFVAILLGACGLRCYSG